MESRGRRRGRGHHGNIREEEEGGVHQHPLSNVKSLLLLADAFQRGVHSKQGDGSETLCHTGAHHSNVFEPELRFDTVLEEGSQNMMNVDAGRRYNDID